MTAFRLPVPFLFFALIVSLLPFAAGRLAASDPPGPGAFTLTLHEIDRTLREGDGLSAADLSGDGRLDPVISTGNGGEVFWFERAKTG